MFDGKLVSYASLITGGSYTTKGHARELAAVGRFVSQWNVLASSLSLAGVGALGTLTFLKAAGRPDSGRITWEWPWLVYLLAIYAVQLGMPGMSLREGAGKVRQMWKLRLVQEMAGGIACLVALALGGRLWSAPVYALARAAVVGGWLKFGDPLLDSADVPPYQASQWFAERWGFQWRIGLSSLSGYLIFRAVTPILFSVQGPVAGGQYGLALSVMNLLLLVSGAWPMSQTAYYRSLLTAKRYREFDKELPRVLLYSTALATLAMVAGLGALWLARGWGLAFAVRIASLRTTAVVLASALAHQAVTCFAVFLRAEGREPLLIPSTVGGVVTVVVIWLVARHGSLFAVAEAQLILALAGIPIVLLIYLSRRRARIRQHPANPSDNSPT